MGLCGTGKIWHFLDFFHGWQKGYVYPKLSEYSCILHHTLEHTFTRDGFCDGLPNACLRYFALSAGSRSGFYERLFAVPCDGFCDGYSETLYPLQLLAFSVLPSVTYGLRSRDGLFFLCSRGVWLRKNKCSGKSVTRPVTLTTM